ncbi:MAG: sigma 54-interacting transcriptional regulator [Desulfobacterales bacterium]|nr:sigma 54-interacting transcriptional regulator [Desulfobacterales bacterium]
MMWDKKYEVGVVISTASLVEQFKTIAKERGQNIHVACKGLDEAITAGKKMESEGVEAIISRRGTAHMLRENLRIPVFSIPQASIDIVKSLKKAATLGSKIVLTAFLNKIAGIDILEELLNIKIIQGIYTDIASMESSILSAKSLGCNVAVGGGSTIRIAEKYALKCVEFETNEEILFETFENAISAAQARREEQKKAYHYQCVIDATTEGIIGVDNAGRIKTINQVARKLLEIKSQEIIDQSASRYVNSESLLRLLNSEVPVRNKLEKVNNELYIFNHLPVTMNNEVIGGVSTFKDIANVMKAENVVRHSLSKGLIAKYFFEDLIHESAIMRDIAIRATQFAKTDSTILIMGATGTGKEIIAQSIHNLSDRAKKPFVSVHCAALPEQLLESELFGYEEGAFTGSKKGGKPGRFELAHKGTIFLDEIDTTPLSVQMRLLRVLQEKEVMRLGADRTVPIDVRILAAAGKDLGISVQEGIFREDLFFRLNVLRITIPPVKNRTEDIPVLLDYFIRKLSAKHGLDPIALPISFVHKLKEYSWPGNVRQLRNFAERLVLNCNLRCSIDAIDELYDELIQYPPGCQVTNSVSSVEPFKLNIKAKKMDQELMIINKTLENAQFSKTKAAKELGISRTTLWRKLKEAGMK